MDWYFVGVDLGQRLDYTAIAVLERAEARGEFDHGVRAYEKTVSLRLRYLERVPLGTPYLEVVERVVQITRDRKLAGRCHLAVDGTGVGTPVVEQLRRERPDAILMPVMITGGHTVSKDRGFYRVPKRDLITGLQMVLQRGELQIAAELPFAKTLVEEMMSMEVRMSPAGNEQFAAWREGQHDDLVFAVALAYWNAQKAFPGPVRDSERWWINGVQEDAGRMFRNFMAEERRA